MGMFVICVMSELVYCSVLISCPFIVQATPRLSEDKVKQCVDPKLKGEYPPKSVAKVTLKLQCCFHFFNLKLLSEV